MLDKMIKSYYNFFDKKIEHGTSIIFIIALLIIFVGVVFSSGNELLYSRNSVLQSNNIVQENVITISGIKYKIVLEKLD